jgi:hypothetical protein
MTLAAMDSSSEMGSGGSPGDYFASAFSLSRTNADQPATAGVALVMMMPFTSYGRNSLAYALPDIAGLLLA